MQIDMQIDMQIERQIDRHRQNNNHHCCPLLAPSPPQPPYHPKGGRIGIICEVAAERARFSCKACKRNLRADSLMHSRDPAECRYPHSVPIHWECPGCKEEKEREFGKCRFADPHARPRPRAG